MAMEAEMYSEDYGISKSQRNEEDEDDEGISEEEDEYGLEADDFGNIWEGMLEKQGKYMLNKTWRHRWCSIKGAKFEYFEDHTKSKSLGFVPLEMCTWEETLDPKKGASGPKTLEMRTIGRASKSGEDAGRTFYFRFLGDTDRVSFFQALSRAAYLRNREVLLQACRVGDALTLHQVLLRFRTMESGGDSAVSAANGGMAVAVASGGAMKVCKPCLFTSDFDPASHHDMTDDSILTKLQAAVDVGTPGVLDATPLDMLLHEADVNGNSLLHLAIKSVETPSWGEDKLNDILNKNPTAPITALGGHGPHSIACVRLLLSPLWSDTSTSAAELIQANAHLNVSGPCSFLLETIDGHGETPLHTSLRMSPFRKTKQDTQVAATQATRRSTNSTEPPFYEVDPFQVLNMNLGSGGLGLCQLLLRAGARPEAVNDKGMNALHLCAAVSEMLPVVKCIHTMHGGTDIDMQDAEGLSPLMHAAVSDNAACAEALIHLKANLGELSWKNGYSALSWAVRSASADVVTLLLDEDKRNHLLNNAPKLIKTAKQEALAPPPMTLAEKKKKEEEEEASTWIDESDASFMASAPKPPPPPSSDGGGDTKTEEEDDDDEEEDEELLAAASKLRPLLVKVQDSRGDLPIHLLARAYVSKSREKTSLKSALLSKYTSIMAELLNQDKSVVNSLGNDDRTPLLILARTEPEPVNMDTIMEIFNLLLEKGADVNSTTKGGHTPLHLAADVGNHGLCRALIGKGADPNAQSSEGYTAYGYVRKKLANKPASGSASSGGATGSIGTGIALQTMRMLQRTQEVLLELGAYRMERSEVAIDQDSVTAVWMKGQDGSHQLKAATAPKTIAYLARSTTDPLDVDAFCLQFHRILRDDKDPHEALAVLLQLLKDTYEHLSSSSTTANNNAITGTVAVHVGCWKILDRCLALREELFHPGSNFADVFDVSENQNTVDERDSTDKFFSGEVKNNLYEHMPPEVLEEKRSVVRKALRDFVASTVRSGLPDAFGIITYKHPIKYPFAYRYAKKCSDADDPIWSAFLSRCPLAVADPLPTPIRNSPAAKSGTYRTLVQLVNSAYLAFLGSGGGGGAHTPLALRTDITPEEKSKGILLYTPQQLGTHLTMLTHAMFCEIPCFEFLDKRYGRDKSYSPHFHALKWLTQNIQYNLLSEVVRKVDLRERAQVVALLVKTAEACLQMNNYDVAVTLVGVLCDSSVHRLRKTWDQVEVLIPKHWGAVQHAIGMAGRSLEQTMSQLTSDPPCLPAVGYICKNLVNYGEREEFIKAAVPEREKDPNAPPPPPPPMLINFDRIRKFGTVVDVVRKSQQVAYPFSDLNQSLLSLLLAVPQYGDEDSTYEQSKRVEAKTKVKGKK